MLVLGRFGQARGVLQDVLVLNFISLRVFIITVKSSNKLMDCASYLKFHQQTRELVRKCDTVKV